MIWRITRNILVAVAVITALGLMAYNNQSASRQRAELRALPTAVEKIRFHEDCNQYDSLTLAATRHLNLKDKGKFYTPILLEEVKRRNPDTDFSKPLQPGTLLNVPASKS